MPNPADLLVLASSAGAALLAVAKVSVPLGVIGSAIELFGKVFGLPKIEAFGDKVEKFFFDLPGLLGRS